EQLDKAEKAFASVSDHTASYGLYFQAKLRRIKTLSKQKKYDEALPLLLSMLGDTKNIEYFATIHLEVANTYLKQGRTDDAIKKYRYIDTAFARTDESARSYFALGNIYESILLNYDSARVIYNKAKAEFSNSEITPDATLKANGFNKYDQLYHDMRNYDSLYQKNLNWNPSLDTQVVSKVDTVAKKDTTLLGKEDENIRRATRPGKKIDSKKDTVVTSDSTNIKILRAKEETRKVMLDSMQRSIVRAKFELAGLFFIELQKPDSALYWYNNIVISNRQSDFTPRSLYTIAEIKHILKQASQHELDSLYTSIINEFPKSPYAQEARRILNMPLQQAVKDSAQEMFENAEALADAKNYEAAIRVYKEVVRKFSSSQLAPKALYTAGWHYENSTNNTDSAIAVYRRVIAQFPSSQYASLARPKVTEVDNEIKRVEQEKQRKIEEQKQKELKEQKEREAKTKNEQAEPLQKQKTDSLKVVPKNDSLLQSQPATLDSLSKFKRI
ncbi:MAG: tetratricopeptide repeat protein, partial [Bacteroidota bacterium]|nr:tetratricopeptide repeat protein [Bacteroidota bacterium]